jgi:translocation and assembly module TamA
MTHESQRGLAAHWRCGLGASTAPAATRWRAGLKLRLAGPGRLRCAMQCVAVCLLLTLAPAPWVVAAEPAESQVGSSTDEEDPLLRFAGMRFEGVEAPALDNLRQRVSLARLKTGTGLRPSRFRYFLRILPRQVDEALQPFGYYHSTVSILPSQIDGALGATVRVELGEPVRVHIERLQIEGEGAQDRRLQAALKDFRPRQGEVLEHARHEESKAALQRLLSERGYFDAKLVKARIAVRRERQQATLDLLWDSGRRYRFGDTHFSGSPFRPGLLEPLLPYRESAAYRQEQLLILQQRLTDLDYFKRIEVQPRQPAEPDAEPDAAPAPPIAAGAVAAEAPQAPAIGIEVALEPAPRNVYRAGLSYGTDTGPGLKLGYTRRWLNDRGHRFEGDLLLGGERSSALLRYRIPAFQRLRGWWTARFAAREEPFPGGRADIFEASLLRDGFWRGNSFSAGLVLQQEQFNSEGALLVYPQLSIERSVSDDPLYPSRGFKWAVLGRWGLSALGSEVPFRQLNASAALVRGLGKRTRLLLRAEAGSIRGSQFERLPPSLRYFAGGDRSVRGYGYQELSPVFEGDQRVGGRKLLVASAELERMLTGQWGAAVFVDAGNAYGSAFEPAVGVGLGLRWRSPVGPVQLDLARGLDEPEQALRLHVRLGPPL